MPTTEPAGNQIGGITSLHPRRRLVQGHWRIVMLLLSLAVALAGCGGGASKSKRAQPAPRAPLVDVARVFTSSKLTTLAEASNFGSARYFRLTPAGESPALVLDFAWRSLVDKGFLVEYEPDNAVLAAWGKEQKETFARWLGRRFSRPVLSDADVESIFDPLRERWARFIEEEPELARRCSEDYSEFRFRRDADGTLRVLVLSPHETPDETLGLEIAAIVNEALDAFHPRVVPDPGRYRDFTLYDYLTSEQIDLEWASYEEGGASGALPDE